MNTQERVLTFNLANKISHEDMMSINGGVSYHRNDTLLLTNIATNMGRDSHQDWNLDL